MDHGHKDEEDNKGKEKAGFMHSSIIAKKIPPRGGVLYRLSDDISPSF